MKNPTIINMEVNQPNRYTTRKPINTNGNTEGIFPSVNFRGILPTDIFPRYIPRELQRDKKIKTKQKTK